MLEEPLIQDVVKPSVLSRLDTLIVVMKNHAASSGFEHLDDEEVLVESDAFGVGSDVYQVWTPRFDSPPDASDEFQECNRFPPRPFPDVFQSRGCCQVDVSAVEGSVDRAAVMDVLPHHGSTVYGRGQVENEENAIHDKRFRQAIKLDILSRNEYIILSSRMAVMSLCGFFEANATIFFVSSAMLCG